MRPLVMGEIVVFDEFVNQRQPRSWAVSHGHSHRSVQRDHGRRRHLQQMIRLSRRTMRGQQIVRKLQPEIEELRKKYEKKPERLFEETMKLYRRHGYGPFDIPAMIGMFAQLPIFAMLYRAIGAALAPGEPPDAVQLFPGAGHACATMTV